MKKTKNLLSCVFAAGMIVVVILVVLYESDILVSGMLAGAHQSEFLWTTLMELATLGCAFLALRLFKFDRVHRALNEQKAVALKKSTPQTDGCDVILDVPALSAGVLTIALSKQ